MNVFKTFRGHTSEWDSDVLHVTAETRTRIRTSILGSQDPGSGSSRTRIRTSSRI